MIVDRPTAADYVLKGSLRRAAGPLQINARLVAASGATVWARRIDAPSVPGAGIQNDIVDALAVEVEGHVGLADLGRRLRPELDPGDAQGLYLAATAAMRSSTPDDYTEAARLLDRALELEPDNIVALAAACGRPAPPYRHGLAGDGRAR